MRHAIISALIICFALAALAVNPREDFYQRILGGQEIGTASFHSGYEPTPKDKYFYYAFVQGETRSWAETHSGFTARGLRYQFLERIIEGADWQYASRILEYVPTKRERFFLHLRDGETLYWATIHSDYKPTAADLYYFDILIDGRSPRLASEARHFVPGEGANPAFFCAYWFGLKPQR